MKRKIVFLLSLIIVLLVSATCGYTASDMKTYSIDEAGITISLPAGYAVFTRNTSADDTSLADFGLTYDGIMSTFEANSIYLDAFEPDGSYEVVIIAEESNAKSFDKCSDEELGKIADNEEAALRSEGKTVSYSDIYKNNSGADFIETKTTDKSSYNEIQYLAVSGGREIRIRFTCYDGEISTEAKDLFKKVIDSVSFDKTTQADSDDNTENAPESGQIADGEESAADSSGAEEPDTQKSSTGIPTPVLYIIIGILIIAIIIILIVKR